MTRQTTGRRPYDVVLYGASGFVGRQTAAYFAQHASAQARPLTWALAGRNAEKLAAVQHHCGAGAAQAGMVLADADDSRALQALARDAHVVLSTAGPFDRYGSKLVAACVNAGTHYVDITGETPWVRGLIDRHHAQAKRHGIRIIPCCGFDSVPSDLGAWLLTQAMPRVWGEACVDVKAGFSLRGGVNGGTLASALNMIETGQNKLLDDPFLLNPRTRKQRLIEAHRDPRGPHHDPDFQAWMAPFVMGPVNTRVVRRSAELLGYGDDFHYQEYLRVGAGPLAGALAASLSVGMALSQAALTLAPLRHAAQRWAPGPGAGPSVAAMDGGCFRCELVGRDAQGHRLRARVADQGDPGNRATTKMVCEAALCLALDLDHLPGGPSQGGLLTPASGLGDALVARLRSAGMTLESLPG